ncbi:lactonase family protein [Solirubrobacter ginsenosidimutans]|uniref:Lactonase family protein n=1 Tax=Solirubrobacter ginsenosidimutans TaxID=490573 RepID=A0A9X3MMV8_9ACTN|nr:beta-propeller fold lactonase family protein [Solirubrobacter ginsenosidimutans]MDA0159040.1 lactonase family protein [Solirubrobacter ginsenosidimutans]
MLPLRVVVACAAALCVTAASAAAAGGVGGLTQLPGKSGCVGEGAGAECAHARELAHATGLAISPDGRNVYTTSFSTGAVAAFVRGSDGALRQLAGDSGCVSEQRGSGCTRVPGLLRGTTNVTVSDDGRNVYVASLTSDQLTVLRRGGDDGRLRRVGCLSYRHRPGCRRDGRLYGITKVVTSADGRSAYAITDAALVGFARDGATGMLRPLHGRSGCVGGGPSCVRTEDFGVPDDVAIAPDGRSLYVVDSELATIVGVVRDPASGALSVHAAARGCADDTPAVACPSAALPGATAVEISPDGRFAYTGSTRAAGPVSFALGNEPGLLQRVVSPPVAESRMTDPYDIDVSRDGTRVYLAGAGPIRMSAFAADPATGVLTQLDGPGGCVAARAGKGCETGHDVTLPRYLVVSPDGRNVYVTSARAGTATSSGTVTAFASSTAQGAQAEAGQGAAQLLVGELGEAP